MRILVVRSYSPTKIFYGGDMRVSRFVDYFSRFAELDLLTLTKPYSGSDPDYVKKTFTSCYSFEPSRKGPVFWDKYIYLLPWQLTQYYSRENQEKFNEIITTNQYDFIFVSKLEPLLYLLRLPKKWHDRVIIDFDDILSDLYAKYYEDRWKARKNSFFLRLNETKALKSFRRVFVCSQDALSKINGKYHPKVGIIPNVYPYAEGAFSMPADKERLLFVGSLDYFPNTEGLKWFFDTVWPQVKQIYPHLKLMVVGKGQKDAVSLHSSFGRPQDVEIVVNAPSVVPYYKDCFASIVPVLNGSGTRLKILESVAFGRPVMTTSKGMEGLDFKENRQILVFEDASAFAASYQRLLDDKIYRDMADGALAVLRQSYSQEAFQKSMDENWRSITQG